MQQFLVYWLCVMENVESSSLITGCCISCKSCCVDKVGSTTGEKQTCHNSCIRFVICEPDQVKT